MAALDRAFPLVQINHVALAVAHQLDLDVARFLDKLFDEHAVVTKAVARFIAARGESFKRFLVVKSHAQPLAAAARAGFDHHRVADALGNFNRPLRRFNRIVHTGNAVHPRRCRELFRFDLVAHGSNRVVLGADEHNAFFFHPLGKRGVLAQKTIAGMHCLRPGLFAGRNNFFSLQVTVAARRGANVDGFVRQFDMARVLVGVGINRHGLNAHLAGGEDDAAGDFTPIGDEDFGKHQTLPSFSITKTRTAPRGWATCSVPTSA